MYYRSKPAVAAHHELHKALILSINEKWPFYGYRKIAMEIGSRNEGLTQKQVRRLMYAMHLKALHAKKATSDQFRCGLGGARGFGWQDLVSNSKFIERREACCHWL